MDFKPLIYNAVRERFHCGFIRDSYACIPERGTHDGLRRVSAFARSVTRNWTRPAFALKADIANFFNSIDHERLIEILERKIPEDWLRALIRQVIFHDPRPGAILQSSPALFGTVPEHKSFLHARPGKGLPIGNLTSQFFANVYLNELDQFVKHGLKAQYYGRYVDDLILFHENVGILNRWYEDIGRFLKDTLGMALHPRKKWLNRADSGVDFVGFVIKPGRTYLRQTSLSRCKQKIRAWKQQGESVDQKTLAALSDSLTSYLGMLRKVNGYNARKALCSRVENLFIRADSGYTKMGIP